MAERQSMTAPEVVAKTMIDEHADFLREAVMMAARELMEAEISSEIGATHGEVSSESATHRNGYRPRLWETRVGAIELAVPRKRDGSSYFPSFLEPRRPCEQAIVAVVMEAYVNGVSTRKVDRLVEELGIAGMSKDRVSRLCRDLDEPVEAFRSRPLEGAFPYLGEVLERFRGPLPKIAELLEEAEEDLLAFYGFPGAHRTKLRSTDPLERFNLSEESLALVLEDQGEEDEEVVAELEAD